MPRTTFTDADFLAAACALAAKRGPAAVTVESVTARLKAPTGSFYYRFASRDVLLAELWLTTARSFQEGFIAAIATGDGLAAALHTPIWVRAHLNEARVFLLHHRDDFVQGAWPAVLRRGVAEQARRVDNCIARFARDRFGSATAPALRRARFVLADVPIAAVRPHLRRGEKPSPDVDTLIRETYEALVLQAAPATNTVLARIISGAASKRNRWRRRSAQSLD